MTRHLTSRSARWLALCLPLIVLACSAGEARAGTYDVPACDAAGGANNSWSAFANISSVIAYAQCPSGGDPDRGMIAKTTLSDGGDSAGAAAQMTFNAPPGTAIVGVRASYDFYRSDSNWQAALSNGSQVLRGCPAGGPAVCSVSSADDWVDVPPSPQLYFDVYCAASSCQQGADPSVGAKARLYSAVVRLDDEVPPSVGSVSGGLWADGWKSGAQSIGFDASDNTGIARNVVLIDGRQSNRADNACDYTNPTPCLNGGASFDVQTSGWADGPHQLQVQTVDSAGNPSTVSRTVLIDNTPPGPPQQLSVNSGEGWRATNSFDARWTNPAPDGDAPVDGAFWQICPATGSATCISGHQDGVSLTSLHGLRVPSDGDWTLRVWLRDQAGNADQRTASAPVHLRYDTGAPSLSFAPTDPTDPTRVAVDATDAISGVASGTIEIKGRTADAWTPLPATLQGGQLVAALPDERLADGVYDLRATASDQAGNQATTATLADGTPASVTLPVRAKTTLQAGQRSGRRLRKHVSLRYHGRVHLSGQLLDSTGHAMAHVPVTVLERTDVSGAAWRAVATTTTTTTGRLGYRTRPGAGRLVRVRYEGTPTVRPSQSDVRVRVAAATTVHVDRRRLRNGQTVHFSGRVHGPHLPRAKLVQLEARVNGRWQPFASARADAKGRWTRGYRFIATRSTQRFSFRILIPAEPGFPFTAGHTRPISVLVHGP